MMASRRKLASSSRRAFQYRRGDCGARARSTTINHGGGASLAGNTRRESAHNCGELASNSIEPAGRTQFDSALRRNALCCRKHCRHKTSRAAINGRLRELARRRFRRPIVLQSPPSLRNKVRKLARSLRRQRVRPRAASRRRKHKAKSSCEMHIGAFVVAAVVVAVRQTR